MEKKHRFLSLYQKKKMMKKYIIDELPLLEYSEDFYSLYTNENSLPVIKALPRASPEQLFYDDDKKTMYSHIYI